MAAHERAVAVAAGDPHAVWNYAVALRRRGQFAEGWKANEARWDRPRFPSLKRATTVPQWRGGPLDGRQILIHDEQGFGDTIQFARHMPVVAAAGGGRSRSRRNWCG